MRIHLLPCFFLLASCRAHPAGAEQGHDIKLATWNLEWLMTPETFGALRDHCSDNDAERRRLYRQLPCDVARNLERSAGDYGALRRYARQLDADVVAIEEVDGPDAARQIFQEHDFCFTGSKALQNNGFAIRRGIPFRCAGDLSGLSMGDTVRRGAVVVLYPGTAREIHLLGVHLKSGCARQPLESALQACQLLVRQLPVLKAWIESQARAGHRFGVLGDFNRDLLAEQRPTPGAKHTTVLAHLNDGAPPHSTLSSVAGREDFRNCARGQRHSGFIDYILLDQALLARRVPQSVERLVWSAADAARRLMSDHCPVAVRIIP